MDITRGRSAALGRPELPGFLVLVVLTGVWAWWAAEWGAWFGVVLLPGAVLLCAALVVLCVAVPGLASPPPRPAAVIALGALLALGAWGAFSALWSPAPDVAVADGQRILVYAVAFGLGLWMAMLLRGRLQLCLIPLAAAGAFAGTVTVVGMLTTDAPGTFLEGDGTLEYPLGYRNANAAFFLIALFPALGLAADQHVNWRARGLALAVATLCAGLALLSQSRGSVPATLIAITAFIVFSPLKLRAICWLVLAALPTLGVIPALTDLFQRADHTSVSALGGELEAAGVAVAWTTAASLLIGAAAARFERVLPGLGSASPRANRGILGALAVGAVAAVGAFALAVGDPIDWAVKRADEFRAGSPDLAGESSRFTFNLGTDRYDLWRVALDDARAQPLLGTGGGGFEYSYLRERESTTQTARDAHSIQLETLGELGIPGLGLLLIALSGATVGAIRSRSLGRQHATVSAVALAAGAYWFAHASIDWFWAYPAITAPVIALLGSACAASAIAVKRRPVARPDAAAARDHGQARAGARAVRVGVAAGAVLLALSAIPPFLSERYRNAAYSDWRADLERAYDDLDRARALNPLALAPLLAEGAIAERAGDRVRAIAAFREATEKRPEEWASHFFLAQLLAEDRPLLARRELQAARRLNPKSPEIADLQRRLSIGGQARTGASDVNPRE